MKRVGVLILILITLIVACIAIANYSTMLSNDSNCTMMTESPNSTDQYIETTEPIAKDDTKTIVVPSDEYYEIVENVCKAAIENKNYSITQISLLRQPYYHIECKAISNTDDSAKNDALLITEAIYNELLNYEYKQSLNIFASSHTIISITFYGVSNDNKNTGLCLQFDILDVDRNKSFEESLKTPIAP